MGLWTKLTASGSVDFLENVHLLNKNSLQLHIKDGLAVSDSIQKSATDWFSAFWKTSDSPRADSTVKLTKQVASRLSILLQWCELENTAN